MKSAISADEAKWQVEDDVRTIKRFNELKKDTKRYDKAVKAIETEIEDYKVLLKSYKK